MGKNFLVQGSDSTALLSETSSLSMCVYVQKYVHTHIHSLFPAKLLSLLLSLPVHVPLSLSLGMFLLPPLWKQGQKQGKQH